MRRLVKRLATLTAALMLTGTLFALDTNLTIEAASLQAAGPPQLRGNAVLFSYSFGEMPDSRRIHTVQAAFAHENYSRLHPFAENDRGIFVLILETPPGVTELRYRLIVDGLWTADPNNDSYVADRWGVRVSEFKLPAIRPQSSYPIVSDGSVEFRLLAGRGQQVSVVGSFNGWDPFMTQMQEIEPGVYTRRLRLAPGTYRYYFQVNGARIPDPENDQQQWNTSGMIVSVVRLP
jgi:hypothetical protein